MSTFTPPIIRPSSLKALNRSSSCSLPLYSTTTSRSEPAFSRPLHLLPDTTTSTSSTSIPYSSILDCRYAHTVCSISSCVCPLIPLNNSSVFALKSATTLSASGTSARIRLLNCSRSTASVFSISSSYSTGIRLSCSDSPKSSRTSFSAA